MQVQKLTGVGNMYDKEENRQLSSNLFKAEKVDTQDYAESIADDINDTIRVEYRTGGSFTEQEVETLIHQALADTDPSVISFSEVNELIDYNLIA